MATSDFWQRISETMGSRDQDGFTQGSTSTAAQGKVRLWMALDALTVLFAVMLATLFEFHLAPVEGVRDFWHGTLFYGRSVGILFGLFSWFSLILILTSRRLNLYSPKRISSFLHEQRLSMQACLVAGLFLTGTLYVLHASDIPRGIVLSTVCITATVLSLRRFLYRVVLYRGYQHGMGTRNVLIVGAGPEAFALRRHLDTMKHLGYTFKGFIAPQTEAAEEAVADVVGTLGSLFQNARRQFVDEILFTGHCELEVVQNVVEQARMLAIDVRVVPDLYDGLAWNSNVEYIGQFPTIPLHCGRVNEVGLVFKRIFDFFFALFVLTLSSPFLLALALIIKLDSPGPVFYVSERIGKKGRVFHCVKFRTMVRDAEKKRSEVMHLNERDGILFKISNDPRITRLGSFLRKYSLDELPQFFNVLSGDMSVVGPRPPIASEVKKYNLSHLRRLQVTPGITGLWQVQGRRDPSFASYVSLDVAYIDNWSIWLDFKIVVRTVFVVFAGTGS